MKGKKNTAGKVIKYINIEDDLYDKSHLLQKNNKNKMKNVNNSNGIFINPSQFIYYPSHRSNNMSTNNLSITLKKNVNKYNNDEYLLYKTTRNFFDKNKKLKNGNYQEEISYHNNPRINNNNININFNINNINNNINNINQIGNDNFNNDNNINNRKNNISKVKGVNNPKNYYYQNNNNNQRRYIYSNNNNINQMNNDNNNNIIVVRSSLSNNVNGNSQFIHYSKNNILLDYDGYEPNIYSGNNYMESNINKNNKGKTLSKASSMKSFNNNIYNNMDSKKNFKNNNINSFNNNNNIILRKQRTEKTNINKSNGVMFNNGFENHNNKYLMYKNDL